MKLHWRYFLVSLVFIAYAVIIPGMLYPVCEGCCVCSVSAHLNDRIFLGIFLLGMATCFMELSLIEEWAHGA